MTDILVRICVGLSGFMLFVGGISVVAEDKRISGGAASVLGLITILRALGVL
jgi:hypothetical protein